MQTNQKNKGVIGLLIILLVFLCSTIALSQNAGMNYKISTGYTIPVQEGNLNSVADADKIRSITYFDDMGRPVQMMTEDATPGGKDMIRHVEYDALGRVSKSFMPYVGEYNMSYTQATQAAQDQYNFYQTATDVVHDTRPYSEVVYDNSPLNRVESSSGTGQAWADASRGSNVQRMNNDASDLVINWKLENNILISDGVYTSGELHKIIITDEEGHQVIVFSNKRGQTLLKKVQAPAADGGWADTYSVYDDFGNLRIVLPPLAVQELETSNMDTSGFPEGFYLVETPTNYEDVAAISGGKIAYTQTGQVIINPGTTLQPGVDIRLYDPPIMHLIDDQAFQYEYDHRHRLIAKRVPGTDWTHIVYDKRDRVVLTQDGNQRLAAKWSFVKYDLLNRPVITGEKVISGSLESIRTTVANFSMLSEQYDGSGLVKYTNQAYPVGIIVDDILNVSYYDNYNFTTETFQALPAGVFTTENDKILPTQSTFTVKGLSTGSMAKISETSAQFVSSVNFFDEKYRLAQTININHTGGRDVMIPQYNWRGQLIKTYVKHTGMDADLGDITIIQEYTYDRMGRHLTTSHQINSEPSKQIVSYTYNSLGQLKNKALADGFDETDYRYNIRGWITQMNNPNDAVAHLFEMEFKYEDATHQRFDGTIGEVEWKNPFESGTNSFDYQYDEMNRIKSAIGGGDAVNVDLAAIDYDLNGNIKHLQRKGIHQETVNQLFDQLTYNYDENTNRLLSIEDASSMSTGFDDGNTTGNDYVYDANGNLIEDKNKGITSITYNHINQPLRVTYDAGKYMEYTYAGAAKVSQRLVDGTIDRRTDYVGGFIYEDDTLQFIGHSHGRIVAERDVNKAFIGFEYQYHLRDHLGNVRVTFKTDIDVDESLATMEDAVSANESQYFSKYDEVTVVKSVLFNHSSAASGNAILLDGSQDRKIGLAKSLKVKPGDVIDMEVYAKYFDRSDQAGWQPLLNTIAGQIAGGAAGVVYEGAVASSGIPFVDFLSGNRTDDSAPKAYLNYFVFDQNYILIGAKSGFEQISTAAKENGTNGAHEQLSNSITITEVGYVYIYLSNDDMVPFDVFFDDFKVTQTHSPVVQKDDYYPFGMSFNSYTKAASTVQNFKFNGGSEKEEMTGWYMTPFRKYDPTIGRFHGVDALADMYPSLTPSHFAANNPIMANDPSGLNAVKIQHDGARGAGGGNSWISGYDSYAVNSSSYKAGRNGGHSWAGPSGSISQDGWTAGSNESDWDAHNGSQTHRDKQAAAGKLGYEHGGETYDSDGNEIVTNAHGDVGVWDQKSTGLFLTGFMPGSGKAVYKETFEPVFIHKLNWWDRLMERAGQNIMLMVDGYSPGNHDSALRDNDGSPARLVMVDGVLQAGTTRDYKRNKTNTKMKNGNEGTKSIMDAIVELFGGSGTKKVAPLVRIPFTGGHDYETGYWIGDTLYMYKPDSVKIVIIEMNEVEIKWD